MILNKRVWHAVSATFSPSHLQSRQLMILVRVYGWQSLQHSLHGIHNSLLLECPWWKSLKRTSTLSSLQIITIHESWQKSLLMDGSLCNLSPPSLQIMTTSWFSTKKSEVMDDSLCKKQISSPPSLLTMATLMIHGKRVNWRIVQFLNRRVIAMNWMLRSTDPSGLICESILVEVEGHFISLYFMYFIISCVSYWDEYIRLRSHMGDKTDLESMMNNLDHFKMHCEDHVRAVFGSCMNWRSLCSTRHLLKRVDSLYTQWTSTPERPSEWTETN